MSIPGETKHKTLYSSEYAVKTDEINPEVRITRWVDSTAELYDIIAQEFGTPKRMWVREGPSMWEVGAEGKVPIK